MKSLRSTYIVGAITMAIICGTVVGYSKDKKDKPASNGNSNQNSKHSGGQTNSPAGGGGGAGGGHRNNDDGGAGGAASTSGHRTDRATPDADAKSNGSGHGQNDADTKRGSTPEATLTKHDTGHGIEETTPSGKVRSRDEKKDDGEHVTKFNEAGTKQSEEIRRTDGSKEVDRFDTRGRVHTEEVVHTDGSRDVSNRQFGRDGNERVKETVKYDVHERVVSKTVVRTVNKVVIENHYDRCRFGFAYHPLFLMAPVVAFYDPFWYSPAGVVIVHPFHYSWGWEGRGWYHAYYGPYWTTYDVYPAPSYWVTDWMVAGYLQDHYDAQISVDQARAEAQAAHDEAARAQQAAQAAQDQAEIAEAKAAQAQAELRAQQAETKLAQAQHAQDMAGKPNPNATPIDKDTKEALKNQIDSTILEKKALAEEAQKGGTPALPDVSKAFADPKHVYPVSKIVSVTAAKDSNPAGSLSEGDLLRVEPGQDDKLKSASENDLITMRVMTSKGDDGEVPAGTLVNVSVHDLQDFDSEFRAKVDAGVEEAGKNKDTFKQGVTGG